MRSYRCRRTILRSTMARRVMWRATARSPGRQRRGKLAPPSKRRGKADTSSCTGEPVGEPSIGLETRAAGWQIEEVLREIGGPRKAAGARGIHPPMQMCWGGGGGQLSEPTSDSHDELSLSD